MSSPFVLVVCWAYALMNISAASSTTLTKFMICAGLLSPETFQHVFGRTLSNAELLVEAACIASDVVRTFTWNNRVVRACGGNTCGLDTHHGALLQLIAGLAPPVCKILSFLHALCPGCHYSPAKSLNGKWYDCHILLSVQAE